MATDLVVIGQGRLVQQGTLADFAHLHADSWVRVRTPQLARLVEAMQAAGGVAAPIDPAAPHAGALVRHIGVERVGEIANAHDIVLHELTVEQSSLEDAFLRATAAVQEFRSGPIPTAPSPVGSPTGPPPPSGPPPPTGPPPPSGPPSPTGFEPGGAR